MILNLEGSGMHPSVMASASIHAQYQPILNLAAELELLWIFNQPAFLTEAFTWNLISVVLGRMVTDCRGSSDPQFEH